MTIKKTVDKHPGITKKEMERKCLAIFVQDKTWELTMMKYLTACKWD